MTIIQTVSIAAFQEEFPKNDILVIEFEADLHQQVCVGLHGTQHEGEIADYAKEIITDQCDLKYDPTSKRHSVSDYYLLLCITQVRC